MTGLISGFTTVIRELGGFTLFLIEILRTALTTYGNLRPTLAQVASVSYRSLSTVLFSGLFVGAILVLQFNLILLKYDAQAFLGGLNTSTVVREVGPLIISFLLAGKIGAFTAAELGTMRVTEQIDAVQCLGTNPIQYLVLPRFLAIVISSLLLLMIGLSVSVAGAMLVGNLVCGVNTLQFLSSIPRFTNLWTLMGGLFKSTVYGVIVGGVACYKGYTASGGARGVGQAVTRAAIYTNLFIVIANFVTSQILEAATLLGRHLLGWMGVSA